MEEKLLKILTEDVLLNLSSYIKVADSFVQDHLNDKDILHLGIVIDNMAAEIEKVKPYYETLKNI